MKQIYGAGGGSGSSAPKQRQAPKPQITQDSESLKSISFAKLQFLLCEGEIEGPAYGNSSEGLEQSVFLDGTPIRQPNGDVTPQPEDLVFSWGRESSQQSGVPDYNRISETIAVDQVVNKGTPISQAAFGSVAGGRYYARVILTWEALYQSVIDGDEASRGNTGDVLNYRVEYKITYVDALGVNRTVYDSSVKGKFSGQFQRSHEFLLEGVGPWTVTVERITENDEDTETDAYTTFSAFNFSTLVLSLDQKFNYNHSSMLTVGVRADRYSAIPNVAVELKGMQIEVPTNYDPESRLYTGIWDGTFKRVYSNNPAWVLRDLIINDRYGAGQYITSDSVDKWTLYEIAQYCDGQVPASGGGTEPRFTCNLLLQSGEEAWNVLQQLSSIFRGLLYYASGLAIATQDRPKDAIFTFNESNTIEQFSEDGKVSKGNFEYSGSSRRARHTVVLASWDNPEDDYEPRIEYVTDDETYSAFGYRPLDLRLLGVTSRGQALRAANWALLTERLLDDTVTFSTNEIGMSLRPGDVIKIADTTKAALRIGGRIAEVNGLDITLDQVPQNPPGGWGGATFSWMYADSNGDPQLHVSNLSGPIGNVITIDSDGGNPPVATFPWLIEFPSRSAQLFRILTVAEEEGGVFSISALRYRDDIYDAVDFDTPLDEDENYLFDVVNPDAPVINVGQVIWDNNQAKIDVRWLPPANTTVLFEYNLQVQSYRVQWESGTVEPDGTINWADARRELPPQFDDRELIELEQLTITDKFRVRVAAVSRLGVQSPWSEFYIVDDITTWFPMPDIGTQLPDGSDRLTFQNQSRGSQLFTWFFNGLSVPPYVNGVFLEVKPDRALNARESAGLKDPDAEGWYAYNTFPLDEYAVAVFHADTNWNCRISLTTAVYGLSGDTYATTLVDRQDIVPPAPDEFAVVTTTLNKSVAPIRRFSWSLPTQNINDEGGGTFPGSGQPNITNNWPLGKVTDITEFQVRYKAGFENTWEYGMELFADGVPGDQRFFETDLFDSGQWTVMIRSVDSTGWISDNQASIVVNLGDAIPTNVVETIVASDTWPGQKVNLEINTGGDWDNSYALCEDPGGTWRVSDVINDPGDSICTDAPNYNDPAFNPGTSSFNNADLTPRSEINIGAGALVQIDPAQDSYWFWAVEVLSDGTGILINTEAEGTYQWFIRRIGDDLQDRIYPNPQSDPMYPDPQTNYFYLETNNDLGVNFHPYAPFEILEAGQYELCCKIRSTDGVGPSALNSVVLELDYPDLRTSLEDVVVPASDQRINFAEPFPHACKAVSVTVQDPAGSVSLPATAYIRGKDVNGFDIRLLDATGSIVSGLIDVVAVGY